MPTAPGGAFRTPRRPRVRAYQTGAGVSALYSTSINGFGGIRVCVEATPAPRFNGEIMRGFGLTFEAANRFVTTNSVNLGGVGISRSVYINNSENWGRWLDSFTNTTQSRLGDAAAGQHRVNAARHAGISRQSRVRS